MATDFSALWRKSYSPNFTTQPNYAGSIPPSKSLTPLMNSYGSSASNAAIRGVNAVPSSTALQSMKFFGKKALGAVNPALALASAGYTGYALGNRFGGKELGQRMMAGTDWGQSEGLGTSEYKPKPQKMYPLTSDFVMQARQNNPDADLETQYPLSQSPKETLPSLDTPSTATQEPVQTNPMEAFQGRLLDRNKKMDDALLQSMQNEQGIQGMNAANSAAAYNNMLQGSIARSANMQRHGSYTPTYQQAQTYTPQAFNFGSQEPKENPYAQFFNKGSMQITPSKNGMKPAEIPQNAITVGGKSIWDSSGKMIDPEMKASTQRFFTPNQPVQETSQDRINKMYVLGRSRNQGSYYDPSQMRWGN